MHIDPDGVMYTECWPIRVIIDLGCVAAGFISVDDLITKERALPSASRPRRCEHLEQRPDRSGLKDLSDASPSTSARAGRHRMAELSQRVVVVLRVGWMPSTRPGHVDIEAASSASFSWWVMVSLTELSRQPSGVRTATSS